MTDPDTLRVWYGDRLVGFLRRSTTNQIGFQYCDEWLTAADRVAISVSLPLSADPHRPEDALAHRFFANLLPEGRVREHIVRDLKIPDTDFDLLRAIGGECAGALSILPDDREPDVESTYQELTEGAFRDLVLRKGQIYAGPHSGATASQFPRLSLAGAQEKCPVLLRDGQFHLPQGEAPSSHILKFAITDYRHVPAYETVLTDLARRIGLHTAVVEFHYLHLNKQAHDYLVIERYDREITTYGEVRRLHQEDFCQALGVGRERKYGTDGGVSFTECFRLLREVSTEPALDAEQLLRWQIFNYLAGNSDGHAKNLSLLYHKDGSIRLAPFYDLVCTRAIERIDPKLALAVGGEHMPGSIRPAHWQRLADELGIKFGYLQTLVAETAEQVREETDPAVEAFQQKHGDYPALQRVQQVVERQCRKLK
ncbi:MAG: type II toxin-antitoxin system HipA family toxin [Gammaproteobacteria bacterium]|nr:type II toxin-antitoxin system HipA family toxin [Gammaproteobacteria bacterium]